MFTTPWPRMEGEMSDADMLWWDLDVDPITGVASNPMSVLNLFRPRQHWGHDRDPQEYQHRMLVHRAWSLRCQEVCEGGKPDEQWCCAKHRHLFALCPELIRLFMKANQAAWNKGGLILGVPEYKASPGPVRRAEIDDSMPDLVEEDEDSMPDLVEEEDENMPDLVDDEGDEQEFRTLMLHSPPTCTGS